MWEVEGNKPVPVPSSLCVRSLLLAYNPSKPQLNISCAKKSIQTFYFVCVSENSLPFCNFFGLTCQLRSLSDIFLHLWSFLYILDQGFVLFKILWPTFYNGFHLLCILSDTFNKIFFFYDEEAPNCLAADNKRFFCSTWTTTLQFPAWHEYAPHRLQIQKLSAGEKLSLHIFELFHPESLTERLRPSRTGKEHLETGVFPGCKYHITLKGPQHQWSKSKTKEGGVLRLHQVAAGDSPWGNVAGGSPVVAA